MAGTEGMGCYFEGMGLDDDIVVDLDTEFGWKALQGRCVGCVG